MSSTRRIRIKHSHMQFGLAQLKTKWASGPAPKWHDDIFTYYQQGS
ncbi:hypothetical protein KPSA1_06124 [Pseudomonas syringae pv. actinidiae]|uniref:Uncharacterized protein n=1 Tax=Pseudomonas syringae pv. actinidiae TaxID=103796 RepID=A0A2V0QHN6_PSESF|nr:hypothetical protein KPSA1_06124 [Pseudomonas syringae pv. actinidiae]